MIRPPEIFRRFFIIRQLVSSQIVASLSSSSLFIFDLEISGFTCCEQNHYAICNDFVNLQSKAINQTPCSYPLISDS
jgi:hypothetical protein